MKITDADDLGIAPICPHCDHDLAEVYRISDQKGWFQGHLGYCYLCPHCRKVLGFADYSSS